MQTNIVSKINFEAKDYYISNQARANAQKLLQKMNKNNKYKLNAAQTAWEVDILSSVSTGKNVKFTDTRYFSQQENNVQRKADTFRCYQQMDNVQNNSHVEPQFHLLNGTNLTAPTFINHNYAPQVFQPPNNIESSNISQPQINPENNNEEHKKRKRATKKESDVRNFKCPHCDKSYLSYPALYTHCKQKHNTNNHSSQGIH